MLIEGRSQYLLKKVRAKAKMYEYHIPEELHGTTEKDVSKLLILAIATIGDFSNEIVDSHNQSEIDYINYQNNLRFSSKFFDAYLDSKLFSGEPEYYLLLGAIVYYLCDYNGSSKVLSSKIDHIDLKINGIDGVIKQILSNEKEIIYSGNYPILDNIVKQYNIFLESGVEFDLKILKKFKRLIYDIGSDRELLFTDALIAIIYLKIKHSTYKLMPQYTAISVNIWNKIIKEGTLITELWKSQRELGELGIFSGKSATIQMPTSSGKTKSIALIILSAFLREQTSQAIVVAPFRSLCREIADELNFSFSFDEGIHINELSDVVQMDILDTLLNFNPNSNEKNIYVVTPEKLLFVLRQNVGWLSGVGLIIFDEGHLFDDRKRGITYELLISTIKLYLSAEIQKILISAVIPNAEEINGWITEGKGQVIKNNVIQTTEKSIGIAEIREKDENDLWYAYIYFLNADDPDTEEFYVPRVIKQVEIDKKGREWKTKVFPELKNGTNSYRNDFAIAFAINLCINGGTAIFCGKKETADKILERILFISDRGYNVSNLLQCTDQQEAIKLSRLIGKHFGKNSDYYKAAKIGACGICYAKRKNWIFDLHFYFGSRCKFTYPLSYNFQCLSRKREN